MSREAQPFRIPLGGIREALKALLFRGVDEFERRERETDIERVLSSFIESRHRGTDLPFVDGLRRHLLERGLDAGLTISLLLSHPLQPDARLGARPMMDILKDAVEERREFEKLHTVQSVFRHRVEADRPEESPGVSGDGDIQERFVHEIGAFLDTCLRVEDDQGTQSLGFLGSFFPSAPVWYKRIGREWWWSTLSGDVTSPGWQPVSRIRAKRGPCAADSRGPWYGRLPPLCHCVIISCLDLCSSVFLRHGCAPHLTPGLLRPETLRSVIDLVALNLQISESELWSRMTSGSGCWSTEQEGERVLETEWYIGELKDGNRHGWGVLRCPDGSMTYQGEWKDGKEDGKGTIYGRDGGVYCEGDFKEGKEHGKGVMYHNNGEIRYEGDFKDGRFHGKGSMYRQADGMKFVGDFYNHKIHGFATAYNRDGSVEYAGEWHNGRSNKYTKRTSRRDSLPQPAWFPSTDPDTVYDVDSAGNVTARHLPL